MKKLMSLFVAGVAVIALSGCGGGGDDYYDPIPVVEINYLIDSYGDPVAGVGYDCLSGEHGVTEPDGAYFFDPYGDSCDFYLVNIADDLHIEDDFYNGVNGLMYTCEVFSGFTGDYVEDGGFDHSWYITDVCTIDY